MADIYKKLQDTGIRIEREDVVPCNGCSVPLPYMVVRCSSEITGDDMGRVQMERTTYTVVLFSREKEPELEHKIKLALASLGRIQVSSFPDGKPYETNFEASKKSILRK